MNPYFFINEKFIPIYDRNPHEKWDAAIGLRALVSNTPPYRTVWLDGNMIAQYAITDCESERIAIMYLFVNGVLQQNDMAKAWGMHKNTMNNYCSAYFKSGIKGLKKDIYSPREVRNTRLKMKKNEHKSKVHTCQINIDDVLGTSKKETCDADEIKPALDLQCTTVVEIEKKPEDEEKIQNNIPEIIAASDIEVNVIESEYGGYILFSPFIEELFGSVFEKLKSSGIKGFQKIYNSILTLIFCVLIGNACPEWLKSMKRKDLGVLIGKDTVACCKTYKEHLSRLSDKDIANLLRAELAKNFVKKGYVELGTIYVDGHFVPYYGTKPVFKGYSTQRRIALPGHYQNWVNDSKGRPIFFRVNNSFVKFTAAILNAVKDIQELMIACEVQEPLIVVFDRGGYDSKLFKELDAMKVGFITWKKGFKEIEAEKFDSSVEYIDNQGITVTYKAFKTNFNIKNYRSDVDGIIICDEKNAKQAAIINNLHHIGLTEKTDSFIVSKIDSRWVQENFFKEAKVKEHIDHHFGYEFENLGELGEMSEHHVDNPEYLKIEAEKNYLKKKFTALQVKKGGLLDKFNQMKRKKNFNDFLMQKSNKKIIEDFEIVATELSKVTEKLKNIEPKIPYSACKLDNSKYIFKTEKTTSLLAIISGVYNTRKRFESIAKECFKDHRELGKFIFQLLNSRAKIRIFEDVIYFTLDPLETPCYQRAAVKMIQKINALGIYDFSKKDRRIIVNFKND